MPHNRLSIRKGEEEMVKVKWCGLSIRQKHLMDFDDDEEDKGTADKKDRRSSSGN